MNARWHVFDAKSDLGTAYEIRKDMEGIDEVMGAILDLVGV
jgi:hypothetical protein